MSRLEKKVAEDKFLNDRDFSINLCKENISSLYLAWIAKIAVIIANMITLIINCLKKEFIEKLDAEL